MRMIAIVTVVAMLLAGCAGAYVAVDGGAGGGAIRAGQDGSR